MNFIESSMEDIPGLPNDYFDKVVSIYALGWTVDLKKTLSNIFRSLKPGGEFIFSWEHPIHTKLAYENGQFILNGSFLKEGPETVIWRDVPVVMYRRKVSTFVNELINAGFVIEQIIEESNIPQNDKSNPARWYSGDRAKITPSTLIVKSRKI
nr:methyltransferase domain-containing protein [Bacillus sp. J14TS2]